MRFRCALIAALVVGRAGAARDARADDPPPSAPGSAPDGEPDSAPGSEPRTEPRGAVDRRSPSAGDGDSDGSDGGAAASAPRGIDPRDTFGLRRPDAAPAVDCGDGLGFACAMPTDPLDDAAPFALATWLPASYLRRLPVGDATHDLVAGFAAGAGRDEAGVAIGGATGLENRWTISGAPADSLRTGAADTLIPLAFLDGLRVTTGGFAARDRVGQGGAIDARLRRGTRQPEVEAEVWTQLSRAPSVRPIASGSYTVRRATAEPGPAVTGSVVATGPIGALSELLGGDAWYAAGIAPELAHRTVTWRAVRLVDADSDGVPDGLPGDLVVAPIETTDAGVWDYSVPVMARAGWDRGAHHLELSLIGAVGRDTAFASNATLQAAGVERDSVVGDAIATWRGVWPTLRARGQFAYHRSSRADSARDPAAADQPQLLAAYVPTTLPDDRALTAVCDDSSPLDPAPLVANCPVPFGFFASGGAGQLTDAVGDRLTGTADVALPLGRHVARAGATLEFSQLVTTSSFTGDELDSSIFPGEVSRRRFYAGECSDTIGEPCGFATGSALNYRTLYVAAYVEDTVALRDDLSIDAGLRWEAMLVGERLHFLRELSPRVGVVWDPLGGGASRVWASYGRTFAMLPAGLGATVIHRDATVEDFEIGDNPLDRRRDSGGAFPVAPGTDPTVQDEVVVGGEVALAGALRARVWGQGRWLRRGLETVDGELGNPGEGGDAIAATRETELVGFQLELRRRDATQLRGGVTWSRTVGTWTGPFDPRVGVTQLAGSDWDVDTTNLYGPLPTDAGARVFVEGEHRATLGEVAVAVAARLTANAGRPRSALTDGQGDIVELLPRGSAGRGSLIAQANLRLAARWRRVEATLDVVNLLDRREVTNLDEVYTGDAVRPISGGAASDLVFLKDDGGAPAHRRTAFQVPTAYQAPLAVTLGVHTAF